MASTASEETAGERPEAEVNEPKTPPKEMTPGQRLAARKAAKAQRKAELKGTQETVVDEVAEEVEKRAEEFTDFWTDHQSTILAGIAGFLLIAVGVLLWSKHEESGAAAEADALYNAVETELAPVDADAPKEGDDPVFASVEDREKASLESYATLEEKFAGSPAAKLGRLGQATAHMELGEFDTAAEGYDAALSALSQPAMKARALEGKAIALEAGGKLDEALSALGELEGLQDGAYQDVAGLHRGRILRAQGKAEEATKVLKAAYDRLTTPEPGAPERSFTRSQVELALTELDSSLVDKGSVGAGSGGLTQEQLQQLIRQMQQNQPPGSN